MCLRKGILLEVESFKRVVLCPWELHITVFKGNMRTEVTSAAHTYFYWTAKSLVPHKPFRLWLTTVILTCTVNIRSHQSAEYQTLRHSASLLFLKLPALIVTESKYS